METVVFKNSLDTHFIVENIVINAVSKVKAIPNFILLKLDLELTCFICNIIENEVKPNNSTKKKIDKLNIFIRIINDVFYNMISEEDKKLLIAQVEYLLNNNKIKIADPFIIWSKKVFNYIKNKIV